MFDALIDRQDGEVASIGEASVTKDGLETAQHANISITWSKDPVDPIGPGQVELLFGDRFANVFEEFFCICSQNLLDL